MCCVVVSSSIFALMLICSCIYVSCLFAMMMCIILLLALVLCIILLLAVMWCREAARIEVLKRIPNVLKIDGDMVKPAEREQAAAAVE